MSTFRSILCAVVLSMACSSAGGQGFPSGPIRLIVPFAAGGGNDFLARIIAEESRKSWNQPVIVEN